MRKQSLSQAIGVAVAALFLLSPVPARADVARCFLLEDGTTTVLPTLGGYTCQPEDLNDAGQMVGVSKRSATDWFGHAFLYDGGVMTDLGTLGGNASMAHAINTSGVVVGNALTLAGSWHAFRFEGGVMEDLGVSAEGVESVALDINDAGVIVGFSNGRAFSYFAGTVTDLGVLQPGHSSEAFAVNNAGQIIGMSGSRAFLVDSGVMTDLGTLGGAESVPMAMSESGDVVGYSDVASGERHAFLYREGTMIDLSALVSGGPIAGAAAYAINNSGQVAFWMEEAGDPRRIRSFLYDDGALTELGDFQPIAFDASGRIVGNDDSGPVVYQSGSLTQFPYDDGSYTAAGGGLWVANSAGVAAGRTHGLACPEVPSAFCATASKSNLVVRNAEDSSARRLKWRWSDGPAAIATEIANTAVFCLYDFDNGIPALRMELRAGEASCPDGLRPGSPCFSLVLPHDGVTSFRVAPGEPGRSYARLEAAGADLPMPAPYSVDRFFQQEPAVTVQLIQDRHCWSSEFDASSMNSGRRFKARIR